MSAKYSVERDLDELERMAERLHDYLLGDALFLPIGGGFFRGGGSPQMTIGALLLRRRRLSHFRPTLNSQQHAQLDAALERHGATQREWTVHYEAKLKQEIPSRLKVMGAFFRECGDSPRDCAAAYPVEALRRTIVQEILLALDEFGYVKGEVLAQVNQADQALRRILHAEDFIWSAPLEPVYAQDTFWWLYGRPAA